MDAELVFFAADRPEAVEAVAAPVFRQFDDGMAVGFAFGLPREVERFAAFEPRTDVQRVGKVVAPVGLTLYFLWEVVTLPLQPSSLPLTLFSMG